MGIPVSCTKSEVAVRLGNGAKDNPFGEECNTGVGCCTGYSNLCGLSQRSGIMTDLMTNFREEDALREKIQQSFAQ